MPGFCIFQNDVCAKETEADIAEHVFSKGRHELKTLIVLFESTFEDLSFHLKASVWDFEEKSGWLFLHVRSKHCTVWKTMKIAFPSIWISKFSGRAACPQTPLGSLCLWCSKSRLLPTFPVGKSTSKLIDSTVKGLISLNPLLPKSDLVYWFYSNARWFYSSKGDLSFLSSTTTSQTLESHLPDWASIFGQFTFFCFPLN